VTEADRRGLWLQDLRGFSREAAYVTSFGESAFLEDSPAGALLRNAGERVLIKVAAVAARLPDDFKARHPQAEWAKLARMRNLVAHHYDHINSELVWAALHRRIPELAQLIDAGQPSST
jgi:uncharacterized protein with HEPN domain